VEGRTFYIAETSRKNCEAVFKSKGIPLLEPASK